MIGLLTPGECKQALLGMAHGKAPGSDGLPMEFFVKFWDVLSLDLVDVLNSCYLSGSLSLSQRRGIISLGDIFPWGIYWMLAIGVLSPFLTWTTSWLFGRLQGAFLKSYIQ